MTIKTKTYTSMPIQVEAIRITEANIEEIAKWCGGEIKTEDHKGEKVRYIKVPVYRAQNEKQKKGYVGDWILDRDGSFKVFTHSAFRKGYTDGEAIPMTDNYQTVGAMIFDQLMEAVKNQPSAAAPDTTTIRMGDHVSQISHATQDQPFSERGC